MLRKPRSIRSILFLTYSVIIVIGIAILFTLFYLWASNILKSNASDTISELSSSLQTQLDAEIQKLDSVSVSILYSNLITDRISAYDVPDTVPTTPPLTEQGTSRFMTPNTDLYDILVALVGPSYPVQQVYLHLFSGISIGVGFDNSQKAIDVASQPWYDSVMRDIKTKVLTLSKSDDRSVPLKNNVSVSLLRHFSNKYNEPKGIVEVKQSYNKVFGGVIRQTKDNPSLEQVIIYDRDGAIIYPYDSTEQARQIVDIIRNDASGNFKYDHRSYITNPETNDKSLVTIRHSDLTNWDIAVMISNTSLLAPLNSFTRLAVLATLIILLLLIIISYIAAKRMTSPLNTLNRTIKSMSLESVVSGSAVELNSGLNEWDRLNASFVKMNARLKESFDQLLVARTQELQAKMTALQSQMNPHFLYNSLATISAMAYEQMNEQIIMMCNNLSDMMRYIASEDSPLVDIQTEIDYTKMYLTCMKLRYGDMLTSKITLDASIPQYRIPKIMIQPLVENAIKYGTKTSPPWEVIIRGNVVDQRWMIEVQDNGPGFDDEELSRFYTQVRAMEQNNTLPALKLHGMGLLNIYIRLKLHYGKQMIFSISNLSGRGAVITIGGPLINQEKG